MPRENRKRGKKHKKTKEDDQYAPVTDHAQQNVPEQQPENGEPSWIRPSDNHQDEFNPEAPFGYVDADVKAYFRTVDVQIRDWQENAEPKDTDADSDPNEEKRLFFVAALDEMRDKEKQLATDPDCSVVLERMAHSMDDFVRRVFVDSLVGSFETLSRHRFASHVVQTLCTISRDTIARETRGILPSVPNQPESGELRSLTQLVLDICEELLGILSSLVLDPFASHVIRALLLLLSPNIASEDETHSLLRSKKSSAWKAKQGSMKSVFSNEKGKQKAESQKQVPPEFSAMAKRLVQTLQSDLNGNEVRAMAASKVASPCLKVFLQVEADQDMSNKPDSLLDRVTMGIITSCRSGSESVPEESDYVGTLLRDPTSSHLLETIVSHCPNDAFDVLWKLYFKGKLAKLTAHPVANFVVAKALERSSIEQLSDVSDELKEIWNRSIRTSRTGVLRAFIERAASLNAMGKEVEQAVLSAFGAKASEPALVSCILSVLVLEDYKRYKAESATQASQNHDRVGQRSHADSKKSDPLQPKTQGSVLIQAFLQLPEPHNAFIVQSIQQLPVEEKIAVGHDPSASRIYDVLLDSPTVSLKAKRQFVMDLIGHYHELVDDRIGSRVGDRCWAFSDTYLKEKIARSLIPHEHNLAGSFYGKFFARNLNLYLLQRRPDEWRNMQSEKKKQMQQGQAAPTASKPVATKPVTAPAPVPLPESAASPRKKRKRSKPEDEIEELFSTALGNKIKKAALGGGEGPTASTENDRAGGTARKEAAADSDAGLDAVLGAIRRAPKHDEGRTKKKHKRQ